MGRSAGIEYLLPEELVALVSSRRGSVRAKVQANNRSPKGGRLHVGTLRAPTNSPAPRAEGGQHSSRSALQPRPDPAASRGHRWLPSTASPATRTPGSRHSWRGVRHGGVGRGGRPARTDRDRLPRRSTEPKALSRGWLRHTKTDHFGRVDFPNKNGLARVLDRVEATGEDRIGEGHYGRGSPRSSGVTRVRVQL